MEDFQNVNPDIPLTKYCRNSTNREGDTFVGIKSESIDGEHNLSIHFPVGYRISDKEDDVRDEILELISILQEYNDEKSRISKITPEQVLKTEMFPVQAYMTVIMEYLNNGYYQITEEQFARGTTGKIHWPKTILLETKNAIPTEHGMVYPNYRVKQYNETDKDLITEINKFCVYQSYVRLGWIYKLPLPQKPRPVDDIQLYKEFLHTKKLRTNVDKDKRLFQSMLDILNFENTTDDPEQFYFGTNNFEYIWERIIQATFGNVEKEYYFPRTNWLLNFGSKRVNRALEPDTIMKESEDIFILDAKYYKYGVTRNPSDLPNSSSINKQLSYGEYVKYNEKFDKQRNSGMEVYNAFLMPYDSHEKVYNPEGKSINYYSIGEAVSEWKDGKDKYQKVQGILVDTKWLIRNSVRPSENEIFKLSQSIKNSVSENNGSTIYRTDDFF